MKGSVNLKIDSALYLKHKKEGYRKVSEHLKMFNRTLEV